MAIHLSETQYQQIVAELQGSPNAIDQALLTAIAGPGQVEITPALLDLLHDLANQPDSSVAPIASDWLRLYKLGATCLVFGD